MAQGLTSATTKAHRLTVCSSVSTSLTKSLADNRSGLVSLMTRGQRRPLLAELEDADEGPAKTRCDSRSPAYPPPRAPALPGSLAFDPGALEPLEEPGEVEDDRLLARRRADWHPLPVVRLIQAEDLHALLARRGLPREPHLTVTLEISARIWPSNPRVEGDAAAHFTRPR